MLERMELAGVVFATGLVLIIVGLVGVGGESWVDWAIGLVGLALAVLASAWWRLLRSRR